MKQRTAINRIICKMSQHIIISLFEARYFTALRCIMRQASYLNHIRVCILKNRSKILIIVIDKFYLHIRLYRFK